MRKTSGLKKSMCGAPDLAPAKPWSLRSEAAGQTGWAEVRRSEASGVILPEGAARTEGRGCHPRKASET